MAAICCSTLFYAGSEQVKMVHSFIYDGDQNRDFISALGIRWSVPMREALYNRHVAFSCADGGVWSEAVQPLADHRILNNNPSLQIQQLEGKRIPDSQQCDERSRILLDHWASWNSYRLSQLTPDAFLFVNVLMMIILGSELFRDHVVRDMLLLVI